MKQLKFWRRLWQVWVIGTVAWAVMTFWQSDPQCLMQLVNPSADNSPSCDLDIDHYFQVLVSMFGWPALVAILILASRWAIAGFSGLRNLT
jgi:hypothetical protein